MKKKDYSNLIDRFKNTKIAVIGDLMVDRFILGRVNRISPEAPVPVVEVKEIVSSAGGAGNVVMNLAALGCEVSCCGVLGSDEVGKNLLQQFQKAKVKVDAIRIDSLRPTTVKTRVIAEHQQIVRFDREQKIPLSSHLQNEIENFLRERILGSDGIILSDYGKGVITKKIIQLAIQVSKKYGKPVCVDPKVEHFQMYRGVTCITPNLLEAMGGMHRLHCDGQEAVAHLGREILRKLQCRSVLITQGEEGMTLFEKNRITHIPTIAKEVFDVTGAGDTVIAVLCLAIASGAVLADAARLANLAAGIVVGKLGTATVTPPELKEALRYL